MSDREDLSKYKPRLKDYLSRRGIEITRTDADRIKCLNASGHARGDANPSMIVYDENLYCPACGATMDIFEAARIMAGLSDTPSEFPKIIDEVKSTLGELTGTPASFTLSANPAPAVPRVKKQRDAKPHVSLTLDKAREYYTKSQIIKLGSMGLCGKGGIPKEIFTNGTGISMIEGTWKNFDADGKLAFTECRFPASDFVDGKKKYLTIWFDGEHLKTSNPPILLFNRDQLAAFPEMDACFHEGPKSIFSAVDVIPGFIMTGWNSGGKKLCYCDFEPVRGRNVFIYPDDDEPGRKTALELKKILENEYECTVKICEPLPEARTIKANAADIVEALQVKTGDELAEYIRNGPELKSIEVETTTGEKKHVELNSGESTPPKPPKPPVTSYQAHRDPAVFPFRILGTADDGQTYYIDRAGRLAKFKLSTLTKNQLQVLAPLSFWVSNFGHKGRVQWDDATDALIELSGHDFDPDTIRGTGAWSEKDGRLCYNDGREVHGIPSDARVYLRRSFRDVGITVEPATIETRREMVESAMAMSFETPIDCARLLAWAALAPFGGALPWRPSGLITGDSESGKTTALNLLVRTLGAIADDDICTGGESSGAGVRQHDRYSSRAVVIEEADDDTEKKRRNRDEIFSIMRESTSDDAPKAWKGTIDGQGMSFMMRKMFVFAAISPIVNANADRNRLFFVNMRKAEGTTTGSWKPIKSRIQAAFKDANCRSLRAFTWIHLREIIDGADYLSPICEEIGHLSTRYAYLEGILFSAYHIVFKGGLPDEQAARRFMETAYSLQKPEESTNEAEDMIQRLLDESVPISGDRMKTLPLRSILVGIKTMKAPSGDEVNQNEKLENLSRAEILRYKQTAWAYGLGVNKSGELCIVNNHHAITKITNYGRGYSKILKRHPYAVKDKIQGFTPFASETAKQCTYIREVLETEPVPF